jgi:hypothetical protein
MRRFVALALFGLACTSGCSLDFDSTDQNNDGMGDDADDPTDLPGDEYHACVIATLHECDDADLPPNECTALIAANCNSSECDPTTTPSGMCPPPNDCYGEAFAVCIESGLPPEVCDQIAWDSCYPPPPPCDDPMDPACGCDPDGDGYCPPPPCTDPADPSCCMDGACPPPCDPSDPNTPDGTCGCDPASGEGCDCWSLVFEQCVASGIDPMECAAQADAACYPPPPPPCDDPADPNCWPCPDPSDPMCYPPPACEDPMDPACWPCVPNEDGTCTPTPPDCGPMGCW